MFDVNDPQIIWVSSDAHDGAGGDGTFSLPFSSISRALEHAEPGFTIVLKSGAYNDNLTIQISGTAERPIRITADHDATVEINSGCWFFYDTSDLVISGLTFRDAPFGAISVVGACERNRFDSLRFINCGTAPKASCTFYFGGSGGRCNLVENCRFERKYFPVPNKNETAHDVSIALMISEGDLENEKPIRNHLFRENYFVNYAYGILVGSSNTNDNQYGHIVEYNTVDTCAVEGILVKCGDTQVKGNLVKNCIGNSIAVAAGTGTVIEDNRIVDCNHGVSVNGSGHSVINNCIVRCKSQAIHACGKTDHEKIAACNLFIEDNTFIHCGAETGDAPQKRIAGIRIDPGTTSIIQHNLIYGEGIPYLLSESAGYHDSEEERCEKVAEFVITDNAVSHSAGSLKGVVRIDIVFGNQSDNFENNSGYGAQGWMLWPEGYDPHIDDREDDVDYVEASILEDDNGELIIPGDCDRDEVFGQLFQGALRLGESGTDEESDSEESPYE